jgi:glucose-6-phosphate-specific signal transduction histidine kinase
VSHFMTSNRSQTSHLLKGGSHHNPRVGGSSPSSGIGLVSRLPCVEALQNAIKHGDGATGVWIKLGQSRSRLRLDVRDDGPGFTLGSPDGRGLRNMRDRIEALGGELTIEPGPGRGTGVRGSVPR